MRTLVGFCSTGAIIADLTALKSQEPLSWEMVMFITPFSLGPLFVTLILTSFCKRTASLALLLISTCLYSAWFTYAYLKAFSGHVDSESAFAMVFVGIYSLPVMLPLWIVAYRMRNLPV